MSVIMQHRREEVAAERGSLESDGTGVCKQSSDKLMSCFWNCCRIKFPVSGKLYR